MPEPLPPGTADPNQPNPNPQQNPQYGPYPYGQGGMQMGAYGYPYPNGQHGQPGHHGPHQPPMYDPSQFALIYALLMRIVEHIEREEGGGHYTGNPYPRHYSREEMRRGYDQQGRPIQLHIRSK